MFRLFERNDGAGRGEIVAEPNAQVAVFDGVLPNTERESSRAKRIVRFRRVLVILPGVRAVEIEDETGCVKTNAKFEKLADRNVERNALDRRVIMPMRADVDDLLRGIKPNLIAVEIIGARSGIRDLKA